MKNLQKGFILPLIIILISVLVIGGGVYIYSQKKSTTTKNINVYSTKQNTVTQPATTSVPAVQSDNEAIIKGILNTKVLLSSGDVTKIRAYFQAVYADNPKFFEQAKTSDDKTILSTANLMVNVMKGIDATFLRTNCKITITGNTAKCEWSLGSNGVESITVKKINGVWQ